MYVGLIKNLHGQRLDGDLYEKKTPTKGNRQIARDLYEERGIDGLNEFANYLIERYPNGGYTKEIILSWVKDIISPEDIDKIKVSYCLEKDRDDDDDAR